MAYASKDGKDTVVFVDKEYVEQQPDIEPTKSNDESNEKGQAAAYDPETGEINWDCPCLGGMAQGPCGEEFKAAFSCFVYSEAEPKGVDCVDKFKDMQNCFRQHPDVYGDEIDDDDEDEEEVEKKPETKVSETEKESKMNDEKEEEDSSSASNVVASSMLEEGESSSTFSSWVSSWF